MAFKNRAPFTNCISGISNTQVDNAKDIDIVMPIHKLIEYNDNYAKTSGSLWQYYIDEPNDNLADSESFKSKIKVTGKTPDYQLQLTKYWNIQFAVFYLKCCVCWRITANRWITSLCSS